MKKKSSKELENILSLAESERLQLHHPYVGSEHLLLALLHTKSKLNDFLKNYDVTYSNFKRELLSVVGQCKKDNPSNLYTPLLRKILKRYESKKDENIDSVNEDLFISMLDEGEGIAIRILLKMNIDLDEIYFTLKESEKLSRMEISNKVGIFLNKSVNMGEKVIGRDEEINKIIMTLLRKKKCNPILVGPAGVGKTAIVEELTRRIVKGHVPPSLKGYKVFMIEMGSLISGTKYRGEFEERLNHIIKEIKNDKKTIIFIDEIHSMVGAGGADGAINASDILKPYLARGEIKCIGATTSKEYMSTIIKDKALERRFNVINIEEPNKEEMINLLSRIKKEYENFHDIKIPINVIKSIVTLSDFYMKNVTNPDKSIDLLDSSCAYAKLNHSAVSLTEKDVLNTIYQKTKNSLINSEDFFNRLRKKLAKYISIKDLNSICDSFKFKDNKPISILLSNDIIEDIIKNNLGNINIINIDLNSYYFAVNNSLYQNKVDEENLFNSIINNPFSLIIFKHITSASKYILDEISSINNKGYIELKNNEKIYLNSTVIMACVDEKKTYKTGFNQTKVSSNLPESFVDSFNCDIRNIKLKEICS